jgi:NAD+ kinase
MSGRRGGRALAIVNSRKEGSAACLERIRSRLASDGLGMDILDCGEGPKPLPGEGYDICFTLGGDGTVLFACRALAGSGVPVFPINLGTLGFIADFPRDGWEPWYEKWLAGEMQASERFMLEAEVIRAGRRAFRSICMNDAVVSGSGPAKMLNLSVSISGMPLGIYRSDGVIVATPTGSTAYSVAAGGPIVQPDMDAIVINPICPFTLSNRPIVVSGRESVEVRLDKGQRADAMLTLDGQEAVPLEEGDAVALRGAEERAWLVLRERSRFFTVLRSKLNWSGGPDAGGTGDR